MIEKGSVLVTGGAGFIGSHLVDALIARGETVVVIDDFRDDYDPVTKLSNLGDALASGACELVEGDIRDPEVLDEALGLGVDRVVHLAAVQAGSPNVGVSELADIRVVGTLRLLDRCLAFGVDRVVLASDARASLVADGTDAWAIDAALSRATEIAARPYAGDDGLAIRVLRLPTVYGPRDRPDADIPWMVSTVAALEAVPLAEDGGTLRWMLHVADAVSACMHALSAPRNALTAFATLDISGGPPVTERDLIAYIAQGLGIEASWFTDASLGGAIPSPTLDPGPAEERLGFQALVPLSDGILDILDWGDDSEGFEDEAVEP